LKERSYFQGEGKKGEEKERKVGGKGRGMDIEGGGIGREVKGWDFI